MSDTPDARAVRWYDHHGQQTAAHYDTLDPAQLYAGITPFLPKSPA